MSLSQIYCIETELFTFSLCISLILYPPRLSGSLQATRALMIVGILLTVAGLGVASMGMKCTNCGGDDKVKKSRIAMTGGIVLVVGGTFTLIALY